MKPLRTDSPAELFRSLKIIGTAWLCLVVILFVGATSPDLGWPVWMVLFSAGVLMPLGWGLVGARPLEIPALFFLLILFWLYVSFRLPSGHQAIISAGPWVSWLVVRAVRAMLDWIRCRSFSMSALCLLASSVFPVVGGGWLMAHRAGWMPFGFDALIVLLTVAHFHHAGFTLPLIAGLQARGRDCGWTSGSCALVLAGVPLVAAGITCTHFGILGWVEPAGVVVLVLGALGVAVEQMRTALTAGISFWLRAAFLLSGLSLFCAMLLALGYGLRFVLPGVALPMPQMWAVHGSLNAFGFGLLGLLAWRLHRQGQSAEETFA